MVKSVTQLHHSGPPARSQMQYAKRALCRPLLCAQQRRSMATAASSEMEEVLRRLDALEARVTEALGQGGDTQPGSALPGAAAGGWGSRRERQPLGKDANATEQMADKAADVMEDAAADAVQKLHPALIKFLNSGYLVSQQQLRQRLMQIEWEGSLKLWAQRKGVADFEAYLAEKAEEQGLHVDWSLLQGLYRNPEDLSPLDGHPRARLLAHSMIQASMLEKQLDTYRACADTAKQLANVIESGQRTGVSTLLGAVRKLLPIPFFK